MKADVLIVGGGLMGCATAIELARKGKSVTVFEKDVPGRHASGNNSGGVRCQGRDLREIPFAVESRKMWDLHPKTVSSDCGFYVSPRLRLAENDAEMEVLVKRQEKLNSLGYTHEVVVDLNEVRRLSPNVADHVVGGLVCYTDGLANPMLTSKAYAAAAGREGVQILTRTRVVEVQTMSWGFKLRTADGKVYEGETLINATGAWSGRFSEMLGDPLPVFSAAPTMMVTDRMADMMNGTSLGLTGRLLGLMAAQNGTIIVGGGYRSPHDLEKEKIWIDPMQMTKASKIMIEVLPGLKDAQMIRCWAAFEGCLADKVPIVGSSKQVPGLFHVCGFSAHGFQLAPIMGRVMSQIVLGQQPDFPLDDFRPDRFEQKVK
ncbi:NAD(P)/FAD-dependent oxidoreductase [Desulforhopalus singaporensis]|uniref:Sarcosine oxidase subunit beta n=1 Tax=Desulforhopalus singaporensis TaxID=91360 RepID=A0A1H0JWM6_9BACT|nr:FAD-binding oxidoreductase [Desulforhopalus singaporensis]SDO48086.1 sarcosine oxidase subunit beta [Desulforhopalus singaporensis]